MAFYAGRLILHPALENPTIVVLTDRNDLDDQLFGTFCALPATCCARTPVQADNRERSAQKLLQSASGGVVFTTIQKFFPEEKGDRHPAALRPAEHRRDRRRGPPQPVRLHRRLRPPHARCAARTRRSSGSPARRSSRPTRTRAPSSATTSASTTSSGRSRTARRSRSTTRAAWRSSSLTTTEKPKIDPEFEEVTEGEEVEQQGEAQDQVGAARGNRRHREAARAHRAATSSTTSRRALEAMDGKAMIVCMSRRICVDLYNAIVALRPAMARRRRRQRRDQGRDDRLRLRSARVAAAHPQQGTARGAGQAIPSNPDDPLQDRHRPRHVADRLRRAVPAHDVRRQADARPRADAGDRPREPRLPRQARRSRRRLPRPCRRAEAGARRLHRERRHGQDGASTRRRPSPSCWRSTRSAAGCSTASTGRCGSRERPSSGLRSCPPRRSTSSRRRTASRGFSGRHASCRRRSPSPSPHDEALAIRDDVGFFQAVRAVLAKSTAGEQQDRRGARPRDPPDRLAGRSSPTRSSTSSRRPGCKKPDISILSDEFLAEVRACRSRTSPWSCSQKLLTDEIRTGRASTTSSRRARSPTCSSRRCAATRTAPSRPRR